MNNASFAPQDFSSSGLNIPAYVVSNTATVANTVQYSSFGPFAGEGSFQFPGGTGSYVNFGNQLPLWTGAQLDMTIEFWFYMNGAQTSYPFGRYINPSTNTSDWGFIINSGGYLYFNGQLLIGGIGVNAWNHIAVTIQSNNLRGCVNGSISGGVSISTPGYHSNYVTVLGGNSGAGMTYGYISNFRIVSGLALYTGTFTPPTGPLQPIQGTTQAGLPYGTVLLLRNAPAPGRIQTTRLTGSNSGSVLSFPPAAMTGYSTLLNPGYGQGTYVASSVGDLSASYPSWQAFDKNPTSAVWISAGAYASSAPYGTLGSNVTVDVTGTSYTGEWLQIQMPSSIVLTSYSITAGGVGNGQSPARFWILGSRDGTNWSLVDSRSGVTTWTAGGQLTFSATSSQAFTYFRMVVNQLGAYYASTPNCVIAEWTLNGQIEGLNINPDGKVGLGVVNPTRALEVAGDVVCAGTLSAGNPLMFRNRIINGDFRIDQRAGGAAYTQPSGGPLYGSVDRWAVYGRLASKFSVQQSSVVPTGQGFSNSWLLTSLSAYTTVTSDYYGIAQLIEGYNIADFMWGTAYGVPVTISFWVRSSVTGSYTFNVEGTGLSPSYSVQYAISAANSWQQVVFVIPPPGSGYSANFPTTNTTAMRLWWDLGSSDTTYATSAPGAWVAGDKVRVSGSVNFVATNGATMYITGVQLEKGLVATPYEILPYATQLALCQRYYQKSYQQGDYAGTVGTNGIITASAVNTDSIGGTRFNVPMRATPGTTIYSTAGTAGKATVFNGGADTSAITTTYVTNVGIGYLYISAANLTQGNGYRYQYIADAEI